MKRRNEQKALMILQLILVAVVIGTLVFMLIKKSKGEEEALANGNENRSKSGLSASSGQDLNGGTANAVEGATQPASITFDPNTADSATLVSVGLSPYQAQNVIKYRRKGGEYHRPEDFKRLYGLTIGQWEHIEPLIRIGKSFQYLADTEDVYARNSQTNRNTFSGNDNHASRTTEQETHTPNGGTDSLAYRKRSTSPFYSANRIAKLNAGERVDLATADTNTLQKIPGVGPYYAKRIAEYGERLGGFVSVKQLSDEALDFLPMGIEQYITIQKTSIRKLRINKLSTRELNRHPYITYSQAKQITERVRIYGDIKTWQELLFLSEFSEEDKARLEPYISFE
ncbi:MAG: helix-hairpin-helix domain-containing protein [Bacteroidaceae bacterium]|nr:helix-hairpin-helix domain-containing protein [Bacteroidaceae bacterium]